MLPGRLTRAGLVAAALLVPLACGGSESGGGAIEDNLIRPGVTAINEARTLTCGTNERLLLGAIDLYEVMNGDLPPDEAALIDGGFLREETADFDIVDGQLVPENPDCGDAPSGPPPTDVDIVTDIGSIPTVDELFDLYDAEFITQVGGPDCARQLAVIAVAGLRYEDREGAAPLTFDDLSDDLAEPVTDWTYDAVADQLAPADGSTCTLGDLEPEG